MKIASWQTDGMWQFAPTNNHPMAMQGTECPDKVWHDYCHAREKLIAALGLNQPMWQETSSNDD